MMSVYYIWWTIPCESGTKTVSKNPHYDKPPVVETVMSVQFPELEGFRAAHFGLYWETLRDRYPRLSDQPRLDPIREEKFPKTPVTAFQSVQLLKQLPLGRMWFTSDNNSELIQLQPDRFLFNWRGDDGNYPTYRGNSQTFFKEFDAFCDFCEEHELPPPTPEICEVTYVNHCDPVAGEAAVELAGKIFTGLRWETNHEFLPRPESMKFNRAFVISHNKTPIGRLYAEASIAARRDGAALREFVLLNLTARVNHDPKLGRPLESTLQCAHDWIVRGFADMTNIDMQRDRWEME